MTTPLTDKELDHLLGFIGYGSLSASSWFIGMEEGGGGEENLRTRLQFQAVEDCKAAHEKLGVTRFHGDRPRIQSTWGKMARVMLRLKGETPTREATRRYQAEQLGRSHGETLLAELMPIPKPNIRQWSYDDLIPQFSSRDDYYAAVMPGRIKFLRALFNSHQPRLVIAYGKKYWPSFKQLFPVEKYSREDGFECARSDRTLFVLCDHFAARSMNGRLEPLVQLVGSQLGE
ncbi:hypothetical protein AB1L42_12595 [Thalassoglobus sp. JC818]|uniref:hypothetical protein n=1 Tax=Thalassoglobus sp. JC818 TaxID=3232136 RepID=UPI00345AF0CC